ncbi:MULTISPECIES: hypothetical protein [Bacillales]|uniref:Uncharacterized protein n=1 Tax=Staphylococcus aureus TaxID=1280 RepID=A0A658WGF7_STAAU|nr:MULTISPECIES: hypothetical protein [Bacillales]EHS71467.1 hypothetical protein IS125_0393 [Staphylococcus aureus subsp. aureus IS-125]EHS75141.1 hypothetical protein IS189_0058 [Staphylococcus aureus subsp. aureus IS-189]AEB87534.1 hypothetical protein SAT0131_00438 [Staphylococcus aureus subsp. aureus T0131]AGY88510.1 Hypothetical protein SAZ172_0409 [Staphylococcus aureus subsp. aureus Z172]AID38898.1 hypothetical protein SAXN108_0457 [Staphylococcus aureus]
MVNVFENLKLLKLDMKDKGWVVCGRIKVHTIAAQKYTTPQGA